MVLCIDDLNLPTPDQYGSQPCQELLRQLADRGGWHDRKSHTWKVSCLHHSWTPSLYNVYRVIMLFVVAYVED